MPKMVNFVMFLQFKKSHPKSRIYESPFPNVSFIFSSLGPDSPYIFPTTDIQSREHQSREQGIRAAGVRSLCDLSFPGLLGTMGSPFTGLPGQPAPAKELTVPFLPKSVFGDVTSVAFSRRWGGGSIYGMKWAGTTDQAYSLGSCFQRVSASPSVGPSI